MCICHCAFVIVSSLLELVLSEFFFFFKDNCIGVSPNTVPPPPKERVEKNKVAGSKTVFV